MKRAQFAVWAALAVGLLAYTARAERPHQRVDELAQAVGSRWGKTEPSDPCEPDLSPANDPVPTGLYEGYSPLLLRPYGPVTPDQAKSLPRYLEVSTVDDVSIVIVQPEGRIRWELEYGPHGLVRKVTTVNGELWLESDFHYVDGRLSTKRVSGVGIERRLQFAYETDECGRVTKRSQGTTRWAVTFDQDGAVAKMFQYQTLIRRDTFDLGGRHLITTVGIPADGPDRLRITYERNRNGGLVRVTRRWRAGKDRPADPLQPDPDVGSTELGLLNDQVERHEVLYLIGAPQKRYLEGNGVRRSATDDYSADCWLNAPSSIKYNPADVFIGTEASCICGYCVDAQATLGFDEIMGVQTHWTAGPWVRIDGRLDLTVDHRLLTPNGAREAGALAPGDVVMLSGFRPHAVRSVELLPPGPPRLGINLTTNTGTFEANGYLVESEQPQPCPGPEPKQKER